MPQDFKFFFFKKKRVLFVLLAPLEILSHYPAIDIPHWLSMKTFNESWTKSSEKSLCFKRLRHFFALFFLQNFWILLVFVVVSIVRKFIAMSN